MIVGLDIGKHGHAVACPLSIMPENILKYHDDPSSGFFKLTPSKQSIQLLLLWNPTGIVMEPTGGWYSAFWHRVAEVQNIPVYWMGHADLKGQRAHFGFPNKYDKNDALCLAASYFDPQFIDRHGNKRFLKGYRIKEIQAVRELIFELEQLDKVRTGLVNQLRQRLAYEYPEAAGQAWHPNKKGLTPFLLWLTGQYHYQRRINNYENSIARQLGIDLSGYSIDHANQILTVERRRQETEDQLSQALAANCFVPYLKAFEPFGWSVSMQALILLKVYPFEKFLLNGFPETRWVDTPNNGKQKRHISLQHFQSYMGLSRKVEQSGDGTLIKWSSSAMLRSHLYIWCMARICPKPPRRLDSEIGEKLGAKWDYLKSSKTAKGKDAIIRVCFTATRYLFYRLRNELVF